MRRSRVLCVLAGAATVVAVSVAGCGDSATPEGAEQLANEDKFLSDRLGEFRIVAEGALSTTDRSEAERLAPYKAKAMAAFLTVFLRQKHEIYDKNLDYGDFNGLVRNESIEEMNIQAGSDGTFTFDVDMVAGARQDLLDRLREHPYKVGDDPVTLRVPMKILSDLELEQIGSGGGLRFDDFNPKSMPDSELEWFECRFREEPMAADAYPDYWKLWKGGPSAPGYEETGTLDVAVFYGYDQDKWDTKNARTTWDWMREESFVNLPDFDDLAIDSPPAELEFLVDGGRTPMRLRVSVIHSRVVGATDSLLRQRFVTALAESDVIVYNGHAWLYHGFYLGEGSASAIESEEIPSLFMPKDRSQILVANGCATYANYAGKAYQIEGKSPENLDIFTLINVGAMPLTPEYTKIVIEALSTKAPKSYLEILGTLNSEERYASYPTVMGVHGAEDNPRAHPFADSDKLCTACSRKTDCGYSTGTTCLPYPSGDSFCATICLDDRGCPSGYGCRAPVEDDELVSRRYCVPIPDQTCGGGPGPGPGPGPATDPCEKYGLYGDGLCDEICPKPDPDC